MCLLFPVAAVAQTEEELRALSDEAYGQLNTEKGIETAWTLFDKATEAGNRKYQARAKVIEAKFYTTRLTAPEFREKVKPIMTWLRDNDCIDDFYHVWIYCIMEYSKDGKYLEANDLTNEMHDLAVADDNNYGLQGSYRMKGNLYKSRLAYAQALQCYYQELEYARRVNSKTLYACYYNIGFCEAMECRLDMAQKSSEAGRKIANKPNVVAAFDLIDALIASKQGRYALVDSVYASMLDRLYLLDDEVEELWKYIEIVHFMHHGDYDRSLDSIRCLNEVRQYQVMPKFYEHQGKYKEAYQAHQRLSHYADSLAASYAMLDLGLFTQKVKERQLNEANKTIRAKLVRVSVVFAILLLLAALVMLYMRSRGQKRKAQLLDREKQVKDTFMQDMSRQVRSPLQKISDYAKTLDTRYDELSAEQRSQIVSSLDSSTNQLNKTINKMLELYRLQSQVETDPELCSATQLIGDAVSRVERQNENVKLRVVKSESDSQLTVDRASVVRILEELLENAFRFTESGYVEIGFSASENSGKPCFFVADTAARIPADKREEVFRQFVRLDAEKSGIGLGLPIARRLAENMGGRLYVDGDYDEGNRFVLVI